MQLIHSALVWAATKDTLTKMEFAISATPSAPSVPVKLSVPPAAGLPTSRRHLRALVRLPLRHLFFQQLFLLPEVHERI